MQDEELGYCSGSYKKPERKGSKYIRGQLKYLCPDCGKHYSTDLYGTMTKHGYRLGAASKQKGKTVECLCAQCKKKFQSVDGWDYLCEKCRDKQ
jgi:DNA-directed RNA polymerase subunit RPC12/RpoP